MIQIASTATLLARTWPLWAHMATLGVKWGQKANPTPEGGAWTFAGQKYISAVLCGDLTDKEELAVWRLECSRWREQLR